MPGFLIHGACHGRLFHPFLLLLDVESADNAARAEAIRRRQADELNVADGCDLGFEMAIDTVSGPGALWISSDGYGEPEHVIAFVLACAEAFGLTGRWGFTWALTCSKPRLDGFGGGAQVLDLGARTSLTWTDCDHWLTAMIDLATDPDEGVALT